VVAHVNGKLARICQMSARVLRVIEEAFDARVIHVGKDAEAINLGPNHHARRAAVHDLSQPRRDPGSLPTRRGEYLLTEIEDPSMRI
jgi:hypothetical protein